MRSTRCNFGILAAMSTVLIAGLSAGNVAARPRQQTDSLADAARRAQAEKKSAPTTQKVWTTDDVPKNPGYISIVGTADAPPAEAGTASTPAAAAAPANTPSKAANSGKKRSEIQSDLDAAKLDLNTVTTDLDILTRKQVLDSQSYYGKPDYASDTAGSAQLKDGQDEVDAKKLQVADAQKKVDDLKAQLDALSSDSGGTSDSSSTPSSTPSDNSSSPTTPASPFVTPNSHSTTPSN